MSDTGNDRSRSAHTPGALLFHSRFALVALVVGIFLTSSLVTRLGLMAVQQAVSRDGVAGVLRALATGELFDLLAALWLAAPFTLYLGILPERWFHGRAHRGVFRGGIAVALGLALFVGVAEYFFFDEFNGRFNFVAVDYLIFPYEVATNIWQSFHTGWLLLLIALVTGAALWALRLPLRHALGAATTGRERAAFVSGYAALLALVTVVVTPGLARVSSDRALNEIASNGYYAFFQALMGQDAPYEGLYATRPPAEIFARLRHLLTETATDTTSWVAASTERRVRTPPGGGGARRLNVVVVLEESLGSEFIGVLHPDGKGITPRFDSLAAEGTLFTHTFSTGNRTIRALEATTASLPPLPGISIVRRDGSRDLFTLPEVLRSRGYRTMFIYGGRALFDGMGHFMRANGMERVIEQSDYPRGLFTTAWGVADEAIFDKALAEFDSLSALRQPFYALVLSVSNHRPFTYPAGRIPFDPNRKSREYVVRYADWALGRFVRQARTHAFSDSTLFVLMGDHGARVYGAQEIPLLSYQVPMLFYAPALIPAGVRDSTMASSMDVPPTVMAVLGLEYESKFFGHDLFHIGPGQGRALMTHNNQIALMQGDALAVLGLHQSADVFRVDSGFARQSRVSTPDEAGRSLIEDAIAYFGGADLVYRSGRYHFR
ncbi:MAG: LTA synthase family protein [Gemmatimonadota bacterium]|nr:LTA synthase family protein [Gemmatimonadota bacterium]